MISKKARNLLLQAAIASILAETFATNAVGQEASVGSNPNDTQTSQKSDETAQLESIVVTGTSIRGATPTGSELITLTHDQIAASGAASVQDALATSPALANFGAPFAGGTNGNESFVPNIHGVGFGATLTLVNGVRLPGAGPLEQFADPSVIPISAVERVEVVPDGASSIYGSDAIAGVVNVITRRNFDGLEVRGNYGSASHYQDSNIDFLAGKTWGTGSLMFAYEYRDRGSLQSQYRSYARADQTAKGGGNYMSLNCSPATVQIGSMTYSGQGLTTSPAQGCDTGLVADLIPAQQRQSVFVSFNQELGSRVSFSLDAVFSKFTTTTRNDSGLQIGNATITNSNPYFVAPAGSTATSELVSFSLDREFGGRSVAATTYTRNLTLMPTLVVDLGHEWQATVNGSLGWENDLLAQYGVNQSAVQTALAGTTSSTALNPYGFGPETNSAVLAKINDGYQTRNGSSAKLGELTAKLDGPVVTLPAGPLTAAVGVGIRHETSNESESIGPPGTPERNSDVSRHVSSAFGEIFVPVVNADQNIPGIRTLNLSASARYDRYSSFGGTTNPKLGVTWEVVEGLRLRGSYGTSFQAPSLGDAAPDTVDARVQYLPHYPYPFSPPGEVKNVLLVAGGNPALKPQTATTYSAGFDLKPVFAPGLTLSATYFDVNYKNLIGVALTGTTYTNPAYAPYYTFNPTAAQIAAFTSILPTVNYTPGVPVDILLDARRNNFGTERVAGIDYDLGYSLVLSNDDKVDAHLSGEYLTKFTQQPVAGATPTDLLGTDSAIRSKYRVSVSWQHKDFSSIFAVNRIGGYVNPGVATPTKAFTTCDWRFAYDFKNLMNHVPSAQLSLLVSNLFDKDPPFYNTATGFDASAASPIGRFVQLGFQVDLN